MAEKSTPSKRFVVRSANKITEVFVPETPSSNNRTSSESERTINYPNRSKPKPISNSAVKMLPTQDAVLPPRRVVVIRNQNNPNTHRGPADLAELERNNLRNATPVVTDGRKSVYLIRRSVIHNDHTRSADDNDDEDQINGVESSTRTYTRRTGSSFPRDNVVSPDSQNSSDAATRSSRSRPKSSRYSASDKPVERRENNDDQEDQSISPSPSLSSEDLRQDKNDKKQIEPRYIPDGTDRYFSPPNDSPPSISVEPDRKIQERVRSARFVPRKASAKPKLPINTMDPRENSFSKNESVRPVTVRKPKSPRKARLEENSYSSRSKEKLVEVSQPWSCVGCVSKYTSVIVIIAIILLVLGVAGVGVSAYFLANDSKNNLIPKIVGVVVSSILLIVGVILLCVALICSSPTDDDDDDEEKDKTIISSKASRISTINSNSKYQRDQNGRRPNTAIVNSGTERGSTNNNIIIEMPERLLSGGRESPHSRKRKLNSMMKNLNYVVGDAKKHCKGELPNKVIVKVDNNV